MTAEGRISDLKKLPCDEQHAIASALACNVGYQLIPELSGEEPIVERRSQHRYLFNKAGLIRAASAACVEHPDDEAKRQYLRGLADACHGTTDEETARAIHVARCVIQATKEG